MPYNYFYITVNCTIYPHSTIFSSFISILNCKSLVDGELTCVANTETIVTTGMTAQLLVPGLTFITTFTPTVPGEGLDTNRFITNPADYTVFEFPFWFRAIRGLDQLHRIFL